MGLLRRGRGGVGYPREGGGFMVVDEERRWGGVVVSRGWGAGGGRADWAFNFFFYTNHIVTRIQ